MNLPCKELKRIARDNLNGNYKIPMGAFLAATLIPLAVELPFSMLQKDAQPLPVTIMFYVAEFLITLLSMVLSVGILQLHLSLARKKEMTLGMVFYGFKNHPDRYIIAGLLLIIATLISCIPVITGAVLFFVLDKSPAAIAVLVILGIVSTILAVFVQMWYALALYLLLDHPQMKARESLKISRQIMKGNKGRLFYIYRIADTVYAVFRHRVTLGISIPVTDTGYFLSGCGRGDPIKHKLMLRLIAGY